MTAAAFLDGRKTVTRRRGWKNLKPGDVLMGVEKAQGLKRGEKVKKLGALEVVSVVREPLSAVLRQGQAEIAAEGLPELSPMQFLSRFCGAMRCDATEIVTRIEFKRVEVADA
jgi:hypothetical protein